MSALPVAVRAAAACLLAAAYVAVHVLAGAAPATAHGEGGPPGKGRYEVVADKVPAGVTATILQGRKPGVFLQVADGRKVEVIGEDGSAVARAGRGLPEVAWLDDRLRPPTQPPAETGKDSVVGRWLIPVRVDGRLDVLAGTVRWVTLGYPPHGHGAWYSSWQFAAGGAALCLVLTTALAVVLDRRRSAADLVLEPAG